MDIALTVGGSFLSSFLQVLFHRISRPEFFSLFRRQKHQLHDDQILEKLKWKLFILQAVLEDAENKQAYNLAVKEWFDELQEAVFQADDLLDEMNTEALRLTVEEEFSSSTDQVSSSTDSLNSNVEFLEEIMPKLDGLVQKLEEFVLKIDILGLIKGVESKNQPFQPSTSLVDENDVYGRNADKENIIQVLLSEFANRENVSVISIVGLGGIGKTTLAQLVYNDERLSCEFDTKAWVCISEDYDAMRITNLLLDEFNVSHSSCNQSFNYLQVKLKEGLANKKFLLILDDVWNRDYNDWLTLSSPFKGGKKGSKIVVTTRDEKVALMMGSQHIYHLNLLSEEDCWLLFKKHAFCSRNGHIGNLEFELEGKEIVKKCRGLPLAVKAIAGLLRSKETIEEWCKISRSDEWEDPTNQAGILPSLRLSYNHLPSQLKQCFAYCAIFNKDYWFSKDEVILLWMANDLLQSPKSNKRLEDIGDEFLHELRVRSLIQQLSDGKFYMHDLVNDLAKFVSGKHFLRQEDHGQQNDLLIVARHFSYMVSNTDIFGTFSCVNELKFLRTFLPLYYNGKGTYTRRISQKLLLDVLPASKSLRALSLSGYTITELPKSFANLKQLRLLDLSFTKIRKLPNWICTFYNLQTLLLSHCKDLDEFPEDMEKLINLRHLDLSGVPLKKMPVEIGRLENLQFLSTFIASESSGSSIEELGKLYNLHGEFTISMLENVANGKNASTAKMKNKKNIKKLTLKWSSDGNSSQLVQDVLQGLQPHMNIEHLEIKGYCGTRFPSWLEDRSFFRMVSLCLSNCDHCFCLPALGQLPSLKHLTMLGLSKVLELGKEVYGDTSATKPFPCLQQLRIENLKEWRCWYIPTNRVFSCLEELYLINCPKLNGDIPRQLPSLQILRIYGCPGLVNSHGRLSIFDPGRDSFEQFCSLRELRISGMPKLKELSSFLNLSELLPSLEELYINDCQHIVSFPITRLPTTLKDLVIKHCEKLELEKQEMIRTSPVPIEFLSITGTTGSSRILPLGLFHSLQNLSVNEVKNIEELSIPQGNRSLTWLQQLCIHNLPKLKSLPEGMHNLLPSLQYLSLNNCPEIECFPEGGLPSSIRSLTISNCGRLWSCHKEWSLQRLPFLTNFRFSGTHGEEILPPEDLLLPCTLRSLTLGWHQNLKKLNYGVLQQLTCLESMYISDCPELQWWPEAQLPASLSELKIKECPLVLEQPLEWEKGKNDSGKVGHQG